MLKKAAVENILAAALESGADFAEIYAERTKRSSIAMVNGKVETALGGMDYGAGVRLFFGKLSIFQKLFKSPLIFTRLTRMKH